MPVDVKEFGAVLDGVSDDTAALKAAIASSNDVLISGPCKITETLSIKSPVKISGPSGSLSASYPGKIIFRGVGSAIIVHRANTDSDANGNVTVVQPTSGGDGSTFQNLEIIGSADAGHGVWLKARAIIRDCRISKFGGNGVHIVATSGSSDPLRIGNANTWVVETTRSENNLGWGMYVDGADVNAGMSIGLDVSKNSLGGLFDSSFLGNTHISAHAATNNGPPYKTDNRNARTQFIGCYSESGQKPSELVRPTFVIGGLFGSGFSNDSTAGRLFVGSGIESTPITVNGFTSSGRDISVALSRVENEALTFLADGDNKNGWSWYWHEGSGQWQLRYARLDSGVSQEFTTKLSNLMAGRNYPVGGGETIFPKGLFIGKGNEARRVNVSSAQPGAGNHASGDIIFNNSPGPGGYVGWVFVNTGEWKPFGLIGE